MSLFNKINDVLKAQHNIQSTEVKRLTVRQQQI